MSLKQIFESKFFGGVIFGILILIALILVFRLGMAVGAKKVRFACDWNNNYHVNFAGPRDGFRQDFFKDQDFIEANGSIGKIIKIDQNNLVISGRDNVEKIVMISDKTSIKSQNENLKIQDLKVDDMVVIIGEPDENGQIQANLIRFLPEPRPRENLDQKSTLENLPPTENNK